MTSAPPRTGREWAQNIEKRLRRLERHGSPVAAAVATTQAVLASAPVAATYDTPPTIIQITTDTYAPAVLVGPVPNMPKAKISVSFDVPATDSHDAPVAPDHIEGYLRLTGEQDWSLFDTVLSTEPPVATGLDLSPGQSYDVSLIAVDASGQKSPRSAVSSIVAASDFEHGTPPPAPSEPVLSSALGILLVTWDGLDVTGAEMPGDLAHCEVILDGLVVGSVTKSSPTWPISGLIVGTSHTVSLRAVSTTGRRSDISTETSLTVVGVTGPDLMANSVTTNSIAAGAITAAKLEALLVLTTRIIAGDPNGTNVSLEPDGLHASVPNPEAGGDPLEILSISTEGGVGFAVTDGSGTILGRFDTTGDITAQNAFVNGVLYVDTMHFSGEPVGGLSPGDGTQGPTILGRDLIGTNTQQFIASHPGDTTDDLPWMDGLPHGNIAHGSRQIATEADGVTQYSYAGATDGPDYRAIMDLSFVAVPGRAYIVSAAWPSWRCDDTGTGTFGASILRVAEQSGGKVGLFDGKVLPGARLYAPGNNESYSPYVAIAMRCPEDITEGQQTILMVNYVYANRKAVHVSTDDAATASIDVYDMGRADPFNSGRDRDDRQTGTGPASPSSDPNLQEETFTVTKSDIGMRSFNGAGDRNSFYDGKMAQGYISVNGTMKGMAIFPDFTDTLSGAEVVKVEAYTYWAHWWDSSGGEMHLGTHSNKSLVGDWSNVNSKVENLRQRNFPNPGGGWVTLPDSVNADFKSGQARGLIVTAPSTAHLYYGYATRAKIRITYRKAT